MELTRIERLMWRFNGAVIAVAGLIALCLMVFAGYKGVRALFGTRRVHSVVNIVEGRTQKETFLLGVFFPIPGSPWLASRLEAEQEFQQSYYSKSGSSTRNWLFFDTRNNSSQWLLPDNSSVILTDREIVLNPAGKEKDDRTVVGFLYDIVSNDTNSDGRLDFNDHRALMLYRLSDGKARSVLEGIDVVLGVHQNSSTQAVIFYRHAQKEFFALLNLESGEVGEKKELPRNSDSER